MNKSISVLFFFFPFLSFAQVSFNFGDAELEASLEEININAEADLGAFQVEMQGSYDISDNEWDYLAVELEMEPAEIYLTLELGELSGNSIEEVGAVYTTYKGEGWGVIAKELGIKPGSDAFHALKNNAKGKSDKGNKGNKDNKGKGNK